MTDQPLPREAEPCNCGMAETGMAYGPMANCPEHRNLYPRRPTPPIEPSYGDVASGDSAENKNAITSHSPPIEPEAEPTAIPTPTCPTHSVRMKPDADGVMTCPVSGARFVIENTQEPHEQR